jgi:hypothetical protein
MRSIPRIQNDDLGFTNDVSDVGQLDKSVVVDIVQRLHSLNQCGLISSRTRTKRSEAAGVAC